MKTLQEILKECLDESFAEAPDSFVTEARRELAEHIITAPFVTNAMHRYAKQFIDSANEIIRPAAEILPETYDEDYDNWLEITKLNDYDGTGNDIPNGTS